MHPDSPSPTSASVPSRTPSRGRVAIRYGLISLALALIFIFDTTTRYEVAAAVLYTVVIFVAHSALGRGELIGLTIVSVVLTVVSFALTLGGELDSGLINTGLSIAIIIAIAFLIIRADDARHTAQQTQEQLKKIVQVHGLEGLTTSIAHEVNQPLAAITTSGHACHRWLNQNPPNIDKAHEALDRILHDADRADTIISRIRRLTQGEPPRTNAFEVNTAVREVLELAEAELRRHRITLHTEFAQGLPRALADSVQTQQVVGNLLLNAIQALAGSTTNERRITVASTHDDCHIVVSVIDTGPGIDPEIQPHLFDAFWTTKDDGIGVGLSISQAIIEANGGRIWADTPASGGAAFSISLPVVPQKAPS
ncbi:two-component sensor histidine kinase [Auritidibacter sp. NML130574]|uniref:sensor histidine kinase n=1 Tax=Auritidibacter sp. NML130574 TaxID=2170745 RepID=UPI000D7272E9|nr:ATP-binding protein [Auritidibacter sp. NML130574]AXR74610.1 two-component sensor histidine kinase [Auritidibacter sp. NML130574]